MLLRGRMIAARAVARRAAPFAMLLVVAMLVLLRRAVITAAAVTRASAMSTFRAHFILFAPFFEIINSPPSLNPNFTHTHLSLYNIINTKLCNSVYF